MAIEIVDFPIKNGDFPLQNVSSPEGNCRTNGRVPWPKNNSRATLDLAAATGWHWPAKTAAGAGRSMQNGMLHINHSWNMMISWCFPIFSPWNIRFISIISPSPWNIRLIMVHPHFSIISPSVHRKPHNFPIVSAWCSSPPSYRRLCIRLLGRQVLCAAQFEVEPTAVGPRGGPIASEALEAWAPSKG